LSLPDLSDLQPVEEPPKASSKSTSKLPTLSDLQPAPSKLPDLSDLQPVEGSPPPIPEPIRVGEFMQWRDEHASEPPARAAEALRYSAALGTDPSWTLSNLDAVRQSAEAQTIPWQKLWDEHPALRPFLDDPVKARAIRADAATLPWLEKWITGAWAENPRPPPAGYDPNADYGAYPELQPPEQQLGKFTYPAPIEAVGVGVDEISLAARRGAAASETIRKALQPFLMPGTGAPSEMSQEEFRLLSEPQKEALQQSVERDFETNLLGRVVLAPFRMAPSLAAAAATGAVATALLPSAAAAAPIALGVTVGAGVAAAAKALFWAFQGYGSLHESLGQVEGLSPEARQALAASFSLVGGAAMEVGLDRVSKLAGFEGGTLFRQMVQRTGAAAIASPTIRALLGNFALTTAKSTASGAAAMAVQSGINEVALQMAKQIAAPPEWGMPALKSGLEAQEAVGKALLQGFVQAIPDMLALSAYGAARAEMTRRGEFLQAQQGAATISHLGELARANELRKKFSGGFTELVKGAAAEPGSVDTVYATLDAFNQVARSRGADPREMAAAIVGDGGKAYDKAVTTGQALEIPVEQYLDKVAPNPEVERALLPDLRIDRDGRTLNEARAAQQADLELMKKIQAEPIEESDLAAQRVKSHFQEMQVAAGVPKAQAEANAELVARQYRFAEVRDRARRERSGETPWTSWDYYTKFAPVDIAGWKADDAKAEHPVGMQPPEPPPKAPNGEPLSPEGQIQAERIRRAIEEQNAPRPEAEVSLPPGGERHAQVQNIPQWAADTRAWMEAQEVDGKKRFTPEDIEQRLEGMRGMMSIVEALGVPFHVDWMSSKEAAAELAKAMKLPVGAGAAKKSVEGIPAAGPIRVNEEPIYRVSFDASALCVKRLESNATVNYLQGVMGEALTDQHLITIQALFAEAGKEAPCLYCYVEAARAKIPGLVNGALDELFSPTPDFSRIREDGKPVFDPRIRKLAEAALAEVRSKGLQRSDVDPSVFTDPDVSRGAQGQAMAERAPDLVKFVRARMLQAGVNQPKPYEEYTSQILKAPDELIKALNGFAGFRFFSSSDFQPEHVIDLLQALMDLEMRGGKGHAYTKVEDFVRIFGDTGLKIQTSVFIKEAGRDASGAPIYEADTWQGMDWDVAKRLRAAHPDVGTVLVATSDEQVAWGKRQPWIDYIIPYHSSGLKKKYFSLLEWENYSSSQREKPIGGGEKGQAPRMWELGVADGADTPEKILAAANRYLDLCAERNLTPVFPQFLTADGSPLLPDRSNLDPGYFKLKKDYARTDSPFRPVQTIRDGKPLVDMDVVAEVLGKHLRGETKSLANVKPDLHIAEQAQAVFAEAKAKGVDPAMLALERIKTGRKIVQQEMRVRAAGGEVVETNMDGTMVSVDRLGRERLAQPAYHGTSWRRPTKEDRLLTEFVGSEYGEGSQSRGWGLYFGEAIGTGERYRDIATHGKSTIEIPGSEEMSQSAQDLLNGRWPWIGGDSKTAKAEITKWNEEQIGNAEGFIRRSREDMSRVDSSPSEISLKQQEVYEAQSELEWRMEIRNLMASVKAEDIKKVQGQVYKVDLPDKSEMLDWDRPMSEQEPALLEKLRAAGLWPPEPEKPSSRAEELLGTVGARQAIDEIASRRTGKDFYRALESSLEGEGEKTGVRPDRLASEALNKAGIPGLHFLDRFSRYSGEEAPKTSNFVLWDDSRIRILEELYQKERGAVVFQPLEGGPGFKATISLFTGADASTIAHESMHVFSRLLEALAALPGADPALIAERDTMNRIMGYGSQAELEAARAERQALQSKQDRTPAEEKRLAELVAPEERLSHLFEQYLAEGKAPVKELVPLFTRLKKWLLKAYKSVRNLRDTYRREYGQDLGALHPEASKFFDRILTAEEQVARANEKAGLQPLPGADPETVKAFAAAREEAEARVRGELFDADAKEHSRLMEEERARLRLQLAPAVDNEPTRRAIALLQQGGPIPGGNLKLSRKDVYREYGAPVARQLDAMHPGIFGEKGAGMSPDETAKALGYENGQDLITALGNTSPREVALEARVQKALDALYGPPLIRSPERLAASALDAAAGPRAAQAIIREMSRLADDLAGGERDLRARGVSWRQMTQSATDQVVAGRVSELTPGRYEASAAASGLKAFEAAARAGEAGVTPARRRAALRQAYEARDQQLWALALAHAARDQREQLDARLEDVGKGATPGWRAKLGKAAPELLGAYDSLLEAVGLGTEAQQRARLQTSPATIDQAVAVATAANAEISFDTDVIRDVMQRKIPWNDLTVMQAWEVSAAAANLRAIAVHQNEITTAGRKQALEDWLTEAAGSTVSLPDIRKVANDPRLLSHLKLPFSVLRQMADVLLNDMDTYAHVMDAGNRDGPFHRLFVDRQREAAAKRAALTRQFLSAIDKAFRKSGLNGARLDEVLKGVELDLPMPVEQPRFFTRSDLIMIALNLGNDSNSERLLKGYGWDRAQVLDVLQRHLNAKEWQWVNSVWALLEGNGEGPALYEEMARVHQAETGLRPEKIEAVPFTVKSADGETVEMTGGYFPARYSENSTRQTGERQRQEQINKMLNPGFKGVALRPYSPHSKARAEHFSDTIDLNWRVVPSHVSQVIQDIAYRQFAREAATVISDKRFENLTNAKLGSIAAKFFRPWLAAVVSDRMPSWGDDLDIAQRFLQGLKSRTSIGSIGFSIPVALGDLTQPISAVAMGEIKAQYLFKAQQACAPWNWAATRQFILESDPSIAERSDRIVAKARRELEQMGGVEGRRNKFLQGVVDSAYLFQELTDKATHTPIWMARYLEEQARGLSHEESVRRAGDAVRRTFPPETMADKPRILRSNLSMMLLFYGYANKIYNSQRRDLDTIRQRWHDPGSSLSSVVGAVAGAAAAMAATALVNGVMAEFMSGRGQEPGESTWEWLARKWTGALAYPLPFVAPFIEDLVSKQTAKAFGKAPPPRRDVSIRQVPAMAYFDDAYKRLDKAMADWEAGDEDQAKSILKAVDLMMGFAVGVPVRQVERTVGGATNVIQGEPLDLSKNAVEGVGKLVYGPGSPARGQADNPFKFIQRRLAGKKINLNEPME
jgi:hypothetical protein